LENKIVHNFLIANPNGMNKSFPDRQKYNLCGKNIQKKNQISAKNFGCPLSPILSLFGHNFCSWSPNEKKIIFLGSLSIFISSKKVSKN